MCCTEISEDALSSEFFGFHHQLSTTPLSLRLQLSTLFSFCFSFVKVSNSVSRYDDNGSVSFSNSNDDKPQAVSEAVQENVRPGATKQNFEASQVQQDISPNATKQCVPESVFVKSEPIREDHVSNAVKFLSHPKVKGSPAIYRRSFLERKGLTKEEIYEAFRCVPEVIIPKLKLWIRKVVLEEENDHTKKIDAKPSLAEEAAAAAASAGNTKASQEMLNSRNEERRCFEKFMNLMDVQVQEMKSMSNSISKLEGQANSSGRAFSDHDDHRLSALGTKEINDIPPNPNQQLSNPRIAPRSKDVSGSGVGYGQGRISTLNRPFGTANPGPLLDLKTSTATENRTRRSLLTDNPSLSWISLVVKLKSNLKMDDDRVHDSLRREVETAGGLFVVKLSLELDILRREVEIQLKLAPKLGNYLLTTSGPFVVKLNLHCLESNILRCEVEIGSEIGKLFVDNQRCLLTTSGPFVVKLNLRCLESNILRCEVEIGSEIGKLFVNNQRSLRREVELALSGVQYLSLGPFVVKLNLYCLESNILRCKVEIGSEIEKLFVDNQRSLHREVELAFGPFIMKLNLRCLESNIIRCEVEIGSEIGKLFINNQRSLRREVELAFGPFVVKLNLRCLESNILRREVEISSEFGKLFVDNQPSLRCEVLLNRVSFVLKMKLDSKSCKKFCLAFDAQRFDGVACMFLYWKYSLTPNLRGHTRVV
ncbi:Peroxin 14, putative isoform 1 [Hibiscus syriacus]|uniref:Peroxisomal membrane protein PEX14 n=1 Tax=Hibiscus syriacus TaxID=106335 RepID=A0A6A3AYN0_HIBSY|nr:Peroxin 14, putative isoform 1 [Hibiscus syriacus]